MKSFINRITCVLLMLCMSLCCAVAYAYHDTQTNQVEKTWKEYLAEENQKDIQKRIIVKTKNNSDINEVFARQQITQNVIMEKTYIDRNIYIINIQSDFDTVLDKLSTDADVIYAQEDYKNYLNEAGKQSVWQIQNINDTITDLASYKNEAMIHLSQMEAGGENNTDVLIAAIDTGIDINHIALKDSIFINSAEIPDNGIDDDGNGYIDDSTGWDFFTQDASVYDASTLDAHGTFVAGKIAGQPNNNRAVGVAPNAKILPLKCFNYSYGYTSDIIEAVLYAEKMGVDIVNCSFSSTEYNPALADVIGASDMLFVCATGNYGEDTKATKTYPACYGFDNVISVSSVNTDGQISAFASYGDDIDIYAPGTKVYSAMPKNEYGLRDGTSYSCAYVSGAVAVLKSKNTMLSAKEMKHIVCTPDKRDAVKILDMNRILQPTTQTVVLDEINESVSDDMPFSLRLNGIDKVKLILNNQSYDTVILKVAQTNVKDGLLVNETDQPPKPEYDIDGLKINHEYTINLILLNGTIKRECALNFQILNDAGSFSVEYYNLIDSTENTAVSQLDADDVSENENDWQSINDTTTTAIKVDAYKISDTGQIGINEFKGQRIYGFIGKEGDQDFYWIKPNREGSMNVTLTDIFEDHDYDLYVFDNNGELIGDSTNSRNIIESVVQIPITEEIKNDGFYIEIVGSTGHGTSSNDKYQYTVNLELYGKCDAYEPNTAAEPKGIDIASSADNPLLANINYPDDVDAYTFTVSEAAQLQINIDISESIVPQEGKDSYVVVLKKGNNTIAEGNVSKTIQATLEKGVKYKVIVHTDDGWYSTSNYKLTFQKNPLPEEELMLNQFRMVSGAKEKTYRINLEAGDYVFRSLNTKGTGAVQLKLYNSYDSYKQDRYAVKNDYWEIGSYNPDNTYAKLEYTVPAKGEYYVKLLSNSRLTDKNLDCGFIAQKIEYISLNQASLGEEIEMQEDYEGYYKLAVPGNGTYTVETIKSSSAASDTFLYLDNGAEYNDDYGSGMLSKIVFDTTKTTHYINVSNADYAKSCANKKIACKLKVTRNASSGETPPDIIPPNPSNTGENTSGSSKILITKPERDQDVRMQPGTSVKIEARLTNITTPIILTVNNKEIAFHQTEDGQKDYVTITAEFIPEKNLEYRIEIQGNKKENNAPMHAYRMLGIAVTDEPDDIGLSLPELTLGTEKVASIDREEDRDYFCFVPPATAAYKIYTKGQSVAMQGTLYNKANTSTAYIEAVGQYQSEDKNFTIVKTLQEGRMYYIGVSPRGTGSDTGVYRLIATLATEQDIANQADTIHVTDVRYDGEQVNFGSGNEIWYKVIFDKGIEYAIESTGGNSGNTLVEAQLYDADKKPLASAVHLSGQKDFILTHQGTGTYYLKLKKTGSASNIGLRIAQTNMTDMQPEKRKGGNAIFVNNPEYLTDSKTLSGSKTSYLFQQSGINGKTMLYSTHFLGGQREGFEEERDLNFKEYDMAYYDIDFYNPTNEPVTIRLNSIGYDTTFNGNAWYPMRAISNYYKLPVTKDTYMKYRGEALPAGFYLGDAKEPKELLNLTKNEITVPAGQHYFLLSTHVSWQDAFRFATSRQSGGFIYLYADFEVLDKKEITVGLAVDYEQDLFLQNAEKPNVSCGEYMYNSEYEKDIHSKIKGVDRGHQQIVDYELNYILSNAQAGQKLKQYVIDKKFYGDNRLLNNPVDKWGTHISPYFAAVEAGKLLMPSAAMEYEYADSHGKWMFSYDRVTGKGVNSHRGDSGYINGTIKNDPHPSLDSDGTPAYREILNEVVLGKPFSWLVNRPGGAIVPETDPVTGELIDEITRKDAQFGYLYALASAEWGVEHSYNVQFRNVTNQEMQIKFVLKSNSPAMIAHNADGAWKLVNNVNVEAQENEIFRVTVPANSVKDCAFSLITSAGGGYCEQYFMTCE